MPHLWAVSADGNVEEAGKPKVGQLQSLGSGINEQVLWLEVSMQDAVDVAKLHAKKKLKHEPAARLWRYSPNALHVLAQVLWNVFQHKHNVTWRGDNVKQAIEERVGGGGKGREGEEGRGREGRE